MNSKITKHYTIWEEEQVIFVDFHIPTNINILLIQNLLKNITELNNRKACGLLLDLDHVTGAHPDALTALLQGLDESGIMSIALIAKQETSNILGRVICAVHNGYTPIKIFNKVMNANSWTKRYRVFEDMRLM